MVQVATERRKARTLLRTAGAGLLLVTAASAPQPGSRVGAAGTFASADTLSHASVRAVLTAGHPELLAGGDHKQLVYIVTDQQQRVRRTVVTSIEGVTHARSKPSARAAARVYARPGAVTIMESGRGSSGSEGGYLHRGSDVLREIAAHEAPLRVLTTSSWVTGAVPGGLPVVWITVGP
jgi:hypothetical protein